MLVMVIGIVGPLVLFIVAGLDKRNSWSPDVSLTLQLIATALFMSLSLPAYPDAFSPLRRQLSLTQAVDIRDNSFKRGV